MRKNEVATFVAQTGSSDHRATRQSEHVGRTATVETTELVLT